MSPLNQISRLYYVEPRKLFRSSAFETIYNEKPENLKV